MFRRTAVFAAIALCAALLAPSWALAWSNGPSKDGVAGAGYGTHDWLIDRAVDAAGSDAGWLDVEAARLRSSYPDTAKTDSAFHLFREKGISRGAPYAVGTLYEKAVVAYRNGDVTQASIHIGELSHYYTDILNPFHTSYDALTYDSLHLSYELAVDQCTRYPGDKPQWVAPRDPMIVSDVRKKTVSAAYYSRARYSRLLSAWRSSRSVSNPTVAAITTELMTRGSNDLADIIASVPSAAGRPAAAGNLSLKMSRYYVAQNSKTGALLKVVDAAGKPIEGAGIKLSWQLSGKTVTKLAYTDKYGNASYYQNVGSLPLMKRRTLTAKVTASGKTKAAATKFMATKKLASGRKGVKTSVSTSKPKRGTRVRVSTVCRDTKGKAVKGLKVTFSWYFKGKTVKTTAYTDAKGVARSSYNIGKAKRGYKVKVTGRVQAGGSNRSSSASFTPR